RGGGAQVGGERRGVARRARGDEQSAEDAVGAGGHVALLPGEQPELVAVHRAAERLVLLGRGGQQDGGQDDERGGSHRAAKRPAEALAATDPSLGAEKGDVHAYRALVMTLRAQC